MPIPATAKSHAIRSTGGGHDRFQAFGAREGGDLVSGP